MPESMEPKYEIVLTYPNVCIAYCRTIIASLLNKLFQYTNCRSPS